jgi:hypothetical protein
MRWSDGALREGEMRLSRSGPRAYLPDYVYIAGSLWGRVIKIGVTKNPQRRQNDLRREKYGGLSDWRILYFARARDAYVLESEALYRLRHYERPDHGGSEEIVRCSFTQALDAVSELIAEEAQASAWWASNWPMYLFDRNRTVA